MPSKKTVTILGAGYVGLTTAALFSNAGIKVHLIEPNSERLAAIKQGKSFFYEEGINPIIKWGIDEKMLLPTDSYEAAVAESSVVFSCVGTPDNPDGSSNLSYVYGAAEEAAKYVQPGTTYVQKSTVPVGTGRKLAALFAERNAEVSYVSNPEFLREGTALFDTLYFDRVVAGGDDAGAIQAVLDLYKQLESHRDEIAERAGVKTGAKNGSYITTNLNSAELIKVTANAFLALKISFANSIAMLADKVDADVAEVMDAVGADPRIGRAFLNAGRGYGGGCFPKDVSGLISSGSEHGVDLEIMQAAQRLNQQMPGYIVEKLKVALDNSLKEKTVAVLGLAFKSGTSDVRKSPGVAIANSLSKAGARVRGYDPEANEEASNDLRRDVALAKTVDEATKNADAVIIATDWPELTALDMNLLAKKLTGHVIVDAMNTLDKAAVKDAGLAYIGVGH